MMRTVASSLQLGGPVPADRGGDLARRLARRAVTVRHEQVGEGFGAVGLAVVRARLDHPVGVHREPVARRQRERRHDRVAVEGHPERQLGQEMDRLRRGVAVLEERELVAGVHHGGTHRVGEIDPEEDPVV